MSLVKKLLLTTAAIAGLTFVSCNNGSGIENPEKHAPKINSKPTLAVNEGESYNYKVEATDEDENALNYSLLTAPTWISVGKDGTISGTAPIIDADTISPVSVKVSNGEYSATQEFDLRNKDLETRAAITNSANRLIVLQNGNGAWDWDVTNKTAPTATTYLNIAGVAADGLLSAYDVTGEAKYLDAAKKAGNFIITELDKLPDARIFNAFNIKFLKDLAKASGDLTYSNYAAKKMNDLKTKVTYFGSGAKNISTDGTDGLTAGELVAAEEQVIRNYHPVDGDIPWDLFYFVELAKDAGDITYATAVANGIKNYLDKSGFNDSANSYIMGLSAGIMALKEAGINYDSYLEKLVAEQNSSDGRFETPYSDYGTSKVTATAFALMALKETGHPGASAAVKYLANSIGYGAPKINGWLEGDNLEYSEPDGEAGKALGLFIK